MKSRGNGISRNPPIRRHFKIKPTARNEDPRVTGCGSIEKKKEKKKKEKKEKEKGEKRGRERERERERNG